MTGTQLRSIVAGASAVLFDFDGPMCAVFNGSPAPLIAAELLKLLPNNIPTSRADALRTDDPLEVLDRARQFGRDVVNRVEDSLVAAELQAARSAAPTPGGASCLRSCRASGRRAAIVSNNSAAAIQQYLTDQGLADLVEVVIGRAYGHPDQMKPSPEPIKRALRALSIDPSEVVFVGDSLSDVESASAAGIRSIGLANKPSKWRRLAGADAVIGDMMKLATELTYPALDAPSRQE